MILWNGNPYTNTVMKHPTSLGMGFAKRYYDVWKFRVFKPAKPLQTCVTFFFLRNQWNRLVLGYLGFGYIIHLLLSCELTNGEDVLTAKKAFPGFGHTSWHIAAQFKLVVLVDNGTYHCPWLLPVKNSNSLLTHRFSMQQSELVVTAENGNMQLLYSQTLRWSLMCIHSVAKDVWHVCKSILWNLLLTGPLCLQQPEHFTRIPNMIFWKMMNT